MSPPKFTMSLILLFAGRHAWVRSYMVEHGPECLYTVEALEKFVDDVAHFEVEEEDLLVGILVTVLSTTNITRFLNVRM